MSMIECPECHANISSKALACPGCGNPMESGRPDLPARSAATVPKKHGFFFYVGCIVAAAVVLFFGSAIVAGIMESSQRHSVANDPNAIHADEHITLASDAFGCEYQSKFAEAVDHLARRELSAWAKIVNDKPYCFYGESVAGITWTVLQVRDGVMQISATNYDRDLYKHDYWTLAKWGTKVERQ